jgi:hypothetical protein
MHSNRLSVVCVLSAAAFLCGCDSSSVGGGSSVATSSAAVDVLTYHNDNLRTAQNLQETTLTPASVTSARFGKLRMLPADGLVDAQPLVVSNLNIAGAMHSVVYVVTEHDSVYAYDADTGALLKQVSLLGAGETTSDNRGCGQVTPEIGITATPVIDRTLGPNGTIFIVAMTKDGAGNYFQRLHALDLATLAERPGSPKAVQATYPGTASPNSNGNVVFDPKQYKERPGLLLLNGVVYTAWSSHCDFDPYTGWIIGYNAATLAQSGVLNVMPNGAEGSFWQAGGGLAADPAGNIYALVGNGTFETTLDASGFPNKKDYGNAFVKISMGGTPAVVDYFTMSDTVSQSAADTDLGSGAAMVLPDIQDNSGATLHLAVGAGKDGNLYVVNRDSMGKFNSGSNNVYQEISGIFSGGGIYSAPAYFNHTVYYANVGRTLKAFTITNGKLSTSPTSQSANSFDYPGASPSISANGTKDGIVWAVESTPGSTAVLHAYDASNLASELYNSNQAANNRDHFGNGNKYITPTIANGKVYVGTPNGVAVFGML